MLSQRVATKMGIVVGVLGLVLIIFGSVWITAWIEPNTGSTVYAEDFDAVSAQDLSGNKYPRFVTDVKYTEETIAELIADARNDRNKIVWFGSYMPWTSMGLGIFLTVGAAMVIGLTMLRGGRQSTTS